MFLFPSRNKILLNSCLALVMFLFLFLLFHDQDLGLSLHLFCFCLGNLVDLVDFMPMTQRGRCVDSQEAQTLNS
jgi:hypothetical protein